MYFTDLRAPELCIDISDNIGIITWNLISGAESYNVYHINEEGERELIQEGLTEPRCEIFVFENSDEDGLSNQNSETYVVSSVIHYQNETFEYYSEELTA